MPGSWRHADGQEATNAHRLLRGATIDRHEPPGKGLFGEDEGAPRVIPREIEVDATGKLCALTLFDPVWEVLHAEEQARVMRLLVEGISYDGAAGTAVVGFRATGIQGLAEELTP